MYEISIFKLFRNISRFILYLKNHKYLLQYVWDFNIYISKDLACTSKIKPAILKVNLFLVAAIMVNKNTLGVKMWCGQEKYQLKGVIWECGQD